MSTQVDLPVKFDQNGLVPAVVQDSETGDVLMIGFMNDEALAATRRTGETHFWSRSRQKLWHKGETSGHVQQVEKIFVNCEQNSLLLKVRQIGAVCHDGYATCFYRRLDENNTLTIVRERQFDPAQVYGESVDELEHLAHQWFGAYVYLRDHDLTGVSRTSTVLRSGASSTVSRISDELTELAGVLDGTHIHTDQRADVVLEGSQVLYWVVLTALRAGVGWDELRLDRALSTIEDAVVPDTAAKMLRAEAMSWNNDAAVNGPRLHAVIALVAQATHAAGIEPKQLLLADLAELKTKPYMTEYFAAASAN